MRSPGEAWKGSRPARAPPAVRLLAFSPMAPRDRGVAPASGLILHDLCGEAGPLSYRNGFPYSGNDEPSNQRAEGSVAWSRRKEPHHIGGRSSTDPESYER
jgi:hypothetical protein